MGSRHHHQDIYTIFTLNILTMFYHITGTMSVCNISTNFQGLLEANCESQNLNKIPGDMNPDIEEIRLSHNSINEITRSDLQKYKKLRRLTCIGSKTFVKTDLDAFIDLSELEFLDLSQNDFGTNNQLIFPINIKELHLKETYQNDSLDLSALEKLVLLTLDNNFLTQFPKLNHYSPLVNLSLISNPLQNITVKQIARYCKLQQLLFDNENMLTWKKDCECSRLQEWITRKNISISDGNFNCQIDSPCPQPLITSRMNMLYDNCMNNIKIPVDENEVPEKKSRFSLKHVLWTLLLVTLSAITALSYFVIHSLITIPIKVDHRKQPPITETPILETDAPIVKTEEQEEEQEFVAG